MENRAESASPKLPDKTEILKFDGVRIVDCGNDVYLVTQLDVPDGRGGKQARKLSDESLARALSFIKSRNVEINLVIRPETSDTELRSTIIVGKNGTP